MPQKQRDMRLDALRGMLLIIMAGVHVPTLLSHWLQDPLGFMSDAEGFVFLSAVLAGRAYGGVYQRTDWKTMARRAWDRAKKVYLVHVSLVLAAVLVAWRLADRVAPLANHFHDFLTHPWGSLALVPLLLHQPPLFDILPLYVRMLGATPWLLMAARRWSWKPVLAVSAVGWVVAQFQLGQHLVGDPSRLLPLSLGSFHFLAWQFLWVCGLALGETMLRRPIFREEQRRGVTLVAGMVVVAGFVCRHGIWPDAWFPQGLYAWMDKWSLGPIRLLNFGAWVVLLVAWNPRLPRFSLAPMALLGRNSLPVFAFHLPLVIVATTLIETFPFSTAGQLFIGGLVIVQMFAWALWLESTWQRKPREVPATPALEKAPAPELVPA
jgi:hypothetical protein